MKGQKTNSRWSSSLLFILACAGSAVGLGNIWKFPYITYENGGGAFVIVYLLAIMIIGAPLLFAEMSVGRLSRLNPIDAFEELSKKKFWKIVGMVCLFNTFIILSFYSVVAGWTIDYTLSAALGELNGITFDQAGARFGTFVGDPLKQGLLHTIMISVTGAVVYRGTAGIEKAIKFLMPLLALFIVIIAMSSISLYGAGETASFLFSFDLSKLTTHAVLEALGHAFFTLTVGFGAMIVYGSYFPSNQSLLKASMWIAILDTFFAILACFMIFPIIFGTGMDVKASSSILFTALATKMVSLPGGQWITPIFYTLIGFAALSSTISLLEPIVNFIHQRMGWTRKKSTLVCSFAVWFVGLFSAFSNGGVKALTNIGVMDKLDYFSSNWTLPIAGLLICIFVGYIVPAERKMEVAGNGAVYNVWNILLRYVSPVLVIVVMITKVFA